jgi:hypothetical protein
LKKNVNPMAMKIGIKSFLVIEGRSSPH